LGWDQHHFTPYIDSSEKRQMRLPATPVPVPQPKTLDALYVIRQTGAEGAAGLSAKEPVRITAASGQAAMMAVLGSLFTLDPSDQNTMRASFERASELLAGGLPVYYLDFTRQYSLLPQVLQSLLSHAGELS
jgi:hypothetical protein